MLCPGTEASAELATGARTVARTCRTAPLPYLGQHAGDPPATDIVKDSIAAWITDLRAALRASALTALVGLAPLGAAPATADVAPPEPQAQAPAVPALAQIPNTTNAVLDLITFTARYDQVLPVLPGPYDPDAARLTARVLENMHYSRHPLDQEYSRRFFQRYLDTLDPQHFHFTQGDVEEFTKYRDRLGDLILREGDTRPAHEIFARFLQRVDQRASQAGELLQANAFDFEGDEVYTPNRKESPWPADLAAARALWRQHLRFEYLQEKLNKQEPAEITRKLAQRYKRLLRTLAELDREDVLQFYLSALANAYDPHSDYMGKSQLENFAIGMKLSLFGIGALLRSEDGYCTIESLTPGGPASRSKLLKPNDRIIAVQQDGGEPVDVVDMKLNKVVELIRGPRNTKVTLTIIPADSTDSSARRTFTLVRDEIKLEDQEAKARLHEMPVGGGQTLRVGVIDLPSFYASFDIGKNTDKSEPRSTSVDVARLIKKLVAEGAAGIVLDLRRNGGGSLEEAVKLTGLFIRKGPVVQVRDTSGEITVEEDRDPAVVYDGPLVVLTSRFSASASEILAAAMQDHGRALTVGDKATHGKGTVQTIYELNRFSRRFPESYNPGALKVTIRKFYRANGESTQQTGMTPDIVLPSVANEMEVGEAMQEYSLPWDRIEAAEYADLGRIRPHLEELRRRSEARQADDRDWAYLRDDIEEYRKALKDRSVSLNYERRLTERAEAEARTKARKAEREARPPSGEVVYELTLKLADAAGLPSPVGATNAPPAELEANAAGTGAASADEADDLAGHPVSDVTLQEARRLLIDLIELSRARKSTSPVAATR